MASIGEQVKSTDRFTKHGQLTIGFIQKHAILPVTQLSQNNFVMSAMVAGDSNIQPFDSKVLKSF